MIWVLAAALLLVQPPPVAPAPNPATPPKPLTESPSKESADPTTPPPAAEQAAAPKIMPYLGKPIGLESVCGTAELTDFGLTCSEDDPCSVFLELSTFELSGNKLFLPGNVHTSSHTLWSVLLASDDLGKTWREPHQRIRTATLEDVHFVDFETGWISGHLAQNVPRDPFFLKTADGGKTWRKSSVFAEPEVGVIDYFRFTDRNNGMAILDRHRSGEVRARYQRFESNTGGDVWGMRETSPKPIPVKRDNPLQSEFRLRADPKLKAYRMERKEGARWNTFASFQLAAGECKPDPPPPPPPAAETPPVVPRVIPPLE